MLLANIENLSISINFSTDVDVIGRTKRHFSVQSLSHCIVGYISSCLDILRYTPKEYVNNNRNVFTAQESFDKISNNS